ncbi:MAG TPA: molybdopterin-guanine dinucleotide biosynthesis protein MobB [Oscillospiraceae bacterium]|nr:molybdopterin-guanine dinucleotide biosynthesis protein MobB [Oscillospiraceae bacterium]
MKVFSVFGITKSGKTTTIEKIIAELRKRRYSVGSVKEIHFEKFAIDTEGTNTDRHKKAGSQLVTARGMYETDVLLQRQLAVNEILSFYDHDYVLLEGVTDTCAPKIVTAHSTEEVDARLDETVFAISGRLANSMQEYRGLPVINAITETDKLVDLIIEKVFTRLPDVAPECCAACGVSCTELSASILQGTAKREDCVISDGSVTLTIDDQELSIVPFVQKLLYNAVTGVAKELDGYRGNGEIVVRIKGK